MNKEERMFLRIMESQGYTYDEKQTGEGIKLTFDDGKEYRVTVQEIIDNSAQDRFRFEKVISELKLICNGTYRLIYDNADKWWNILYDSKLDELIKNNEKIAYDIACIFYEELASHEINNYSFYKEEHEKLMLTDKEWLEELHDFDEYE